MRRWQGLRQPERRQRAYGEVVCKCGEYAYRVIGMPRVALDGTDPAYPSAYDRWANIREANRARYVKRGYYDQ